MPLGCESNSVQRPFIRYAVEAGWTYLSPDQALNLRQGGVTSPVLDAVLLGQLTKLNPGVVNAVRALAALFQSLLHHIMTARLRLPEFAKALSY
jgi:type I restriction enzyme, R subunit